MTDEIYMQRCIYLAKKGIRAVAPNPMVGCVLVVENKILVRISWDTARHMQK